VNSAGAEKNAAATENLAFVGAAADELPTAEASPIVSSRTATTAGAENLPSPVQPAVEVQGRFPLP
jgi:hypothetical protein